jgi:hypothetical protein
MVFGRFKGKPKNSRGPGQGYVEFIPGSFNGVIGSKGIVEALVGKALYVRKNEQTANIAVVFPVLALLVMVPYLYGSAMNWAAGASERRHQANEIIFATPTFERIGSGIGFIPSYQAAGRATTNGAQPSYTIQPTYTMQPTYTIQPTYTPMTGEVFYYSYYDPALGSLNCWDWDEELKECHSMMATGLDWRNYFGKSLACGAEFPLYTVFRVIHPLEIAGDYPCLDRCPACTGMRLLDFLDTGQRLPWGYDLLVQVIYQ